jgi:protein TonB
MPTFPGCEHIGNKTERKACSDSTMFAYIYEHLVYPEEAKEKGVEGMVVVTFMVDTTGCLAGIEVVRDIGCGCGKEAQKVIQTMPFWNPGKQRGNKVAVMYNLPVRFEL